ncbi:MAG: hypothetical protein AAFY08_15025 [Planctomycetota bacterium]
MTALIRCATRLASIRHAIPVPIQRPPAAALTLAAALLLTLLAPAASAIMHPQMGRFLQRDPLGYVDGLGVYTQYAVMHGQLDPTGRVSTSFVSPPGYYTQPIRRAHGKVVTSTDATYECEPCGDADETCHMVSNAALELRATIVIDIDDFEDGETRRGVTLSGVFGHEQRHVAAKAAYFETIREEFQELAENSALGQAEGYCQFSSFDECDRAARGWAARLESAVRTRYGRDLRREGRHDNDPDTIYPETGRPYPPTIHPANLGPFNAIRRSIGLIVFDPA